MSRIPENPAKSHRSEPTDDPVIKISQSPGLQFVRTFSVDHSSDVKSAVDGLQSIQVNQVTIEDAITGFAESVNIGLKALDELAKIHPFVAAPVLAFKLVVSLEMKRRENNMKVRAVMAQIQDMFCVLLELHNIKDIAGRSTQIMGRLQELMQRIDKDIQECGSACDVYQKKSILRKLFKSPIYEARLADYASRFVEHQAAIQRILVLHTTHRMEDANLKLDEQQVLLTDMHDQFKALLQRLDTPKEKEIRNIIKDKGGPNICVNNEKVLWELIDKSEDDSFRKTDKELFLKGLSKYESEMRRAKEKSELTITDIQKDLRQELSEDLDKVLAENLEMFHRKLDIQEKEIKDSIERQGDRIISYFSGGHERIINPHIRAVWREMGWRGSIKAVNFVFALRDYFTSPLENPDGDVPSPQDSQALIPSPHPASKVEFPTSQLQVASSRSGEEWAKKYISVSHLQSILESIDDDGSGFINILEVNRFCLDCPKDWSFLQWLAYWAAGWHISILEYKARIYRLIRKMFMLLDKARPDNRMLLHYYLKNTCIIKLEALLQSTKGRDNSKDDPELTKLVNGMMEKDESRLLQNLESMRYKLDSIPTVRLVCGPGRIEKHIYPLVYILLKQHVQIFQLARIHILHYDELDWCSESLDNVMKAFDSRYHDLEATFKQIHIMPETHFENFAFGMFKSSKMNLERNSTYHSVSKKLILDPHEDDDVENRPQGLDTTILKFPTQEPFFLPRTQEPDLFDRLVTDTDSHLGYWTGFCVIRDSDLRSIDGLLRINIEESVAGDGAIKGHAQSFIGKMDITGTLVIEDSGERLLDIVMTYTGDGYWIRCIGKFDSQFSSITGDWYDFDSETRPIPRDPVQGSPEGHFFFTRTPAEVVRFRYSDASFAVNPARARWKFALDVAEYDAQRRRMTKSFVFTRLRQGLRFKDLALRRLLAWNDCSIKGRSELNETDLEELSNLEKVISPSNDWFFYSIANFIYSRITRHDGFYCDNCEGTLVQSRIACLTCRNINLVNGIDLCLGCRNRGTVTSPKFKHDASHSVIHSDSPIHDFQLVWLIPEAKKVSERIRGAFRAVENAAQEKSEISDIAGVKSAPEGHTPLESSPNMDTLNAEEAPVVTKLTVDTSAVAVGSGIKCSLCEKSVSPPCWVYLGQEEDTYVCNNCYEEKLIPPLPEKITSAPPSKSRILLRISSSKDESNVEKDIPTRVEERLQVVKDDLGKRFTELEDKILERTKSLECKLDDHLLSASSMKPEFGNNNQSNESSETVDGVQGNFRTQIEALEQRIERRLSAIESSLDKKLQNLLDVIRGQMESASR